MTNNIALDVFIGLIAIYLLYSLFASILMEIVAKYLALRARMTLRSIFKLLDDGEYTEENALYRFGKTIWGTRFIHPLKNRPLTALFYSHPNIRNLGKSNFNRKPSSITAEMFADTLVQILRGDVFIGQQNQVDLIKASLKVDMDLCSVQPSIPIPIFYTVANYRPATAINSKVVLINKQTFYQLRQFLYDSHSDIDWFKQKLITWFNEMMDRSEGWYIKQTRTILFVVGFILSAIFNIDTIGIANKLSIDKSARDKMVQFASIISKDQKYNGTKTKELSDEALNSALKDVKESLGEARSIVGPPITQKNRFFGWLISAFAISLGAPFWFDLLGKIMCIRQGGNNSSTEKQKKLDNSFTNPIEQPVG